MMPTAQRVARLAAIVALAAIALSACGSQGPPKSPPMMVDLSWMLDWLKIIGGIIGMIGAIVGIIYYYRATLSFKTGDAAKSAIDILQKEVTAARDSRTRIYEENTGLATKIAELSAQLAQAREKTDLSAVMANQREALDQNAKLNQSIVETLQAITEKGEKQYTDALGILKNILAHLNGMAEENKDQLAKNSSALQDVLGVVSRVEQMWIETQKRLANVEDKVDG